MNQRTFKLFKSNSKTIKSNNSEFYFQVALQIQGEPNEDTQWIKVQYPPKQKVEGLCETSLQQL